MTDKNSIDIEYPEGLPIVEHRQQIIEAIRNHRVVIVAGETGSGKTTQLPKMCMEAGRGLKKKIGCTQPRRIAAISVAERVAEELGGQADLVGYKIRFQDRTGKNTRIKFMTDGILLAEAQGDRELSAYDTIIIDEAHERSLNIDFLLGMLKRLLDRRHDLKVIITSATIDTEKFAASFNRAPIIEVSGRSFPVEVRYLPLDPEEEEEGEQTYVNQAVQAVLELRRHDRHGDILVFMPTERDIRETVETIESSLRQVGPAGSAPLVLPLYGRLSPADQRKIFRPAGSQKIVVATNVAETSITVPGIRYVVDTGLARLATYNVRARTSKLPIVPISRAGCEQRKGRCGRVGPGICVRLYGEDDYNNRPEYTLPEILRSNLAEVILRMIYLKLGEPTKFPFVDPPSGRAIQDGYALLAELGALTDDRRLTGKGRLMARLPLDPRIARMIIEARDHNALREVAVIAAALSIQDPRVRPADKEKEADAAHARFTKVDSDFLFFLKLWDAYHDSFDKLQSLSRMRKFCKSHYLSFQRMREWRDIHEQITSILKEEDGYTINTQPAAVADIHRAILSGNLRNIALKKEKNIYQGAGGRQVMVFPGSALFNKSGSWIMAAEIVETSRLYARTVATIEPEWIEPLAGSLCRISYSEPHWEKGRGQVVGFAKVTLFGLVIVARRKVNYATVKPEEARQIFIQSALVEGEIKGNYGFLEKNNDLLERLQSMEDRVRKRDVMVDDYTLAQFYEERVKPGICDQRSLNRWLKELGSDSILCMTERDILKELPEEKTLEQYPLTVMAGEFEVPLSYRFAPGEEDDGVTAHIPISLLPHLRLEFFEWLVPGLLTEKIVFLLKGLPKALRKQLIPLAQTAAEIVGDLRPYHGSLYRALEQIILDAYRVRILASQWPVGDLPPHLKFRFRLIDHQGKVLEQTRDFNLLRKVGGAGGGVGMDQGSLAALKEKWEQANIRPEQFSQIEERLPVTGHAGDLQGFVYPGLAMDEKGGVSRKLYTDRAQGRRNTRQALLSLYLAEFSKQVKAVRKDIAIPRSHWALYEGIGSHEQVNADIFALVMGEVFAVGEGALPSEAEFAERVALVRKQGLYQMCRALYELVVQVLQERRHCLDLISKFAGLSKTGKDPANRFGEYRSQVNLIVPHDFLLNFSTKQLRALPRYLKALAIRIERAHVAPAKDQAKAQQVTVHEQRFAQAAQIANPPSELLALLGQYREMIEEFKVSLFAQELGTAFSVSAKRLDEKWREVEGFC
ncbi:MAG: ATP-dependent RNA helicase HrpA [Desulfobulbaceae bacterium]|nr:ATP-dependent RNA helicase HrpA [Desulfobulbaceae bacterium]HIJ78201.1 ATP-dependent RNA helicase HrpA [Deltaproteobacteria bacterium]